MDNQPLTQNQPLQNLINQQSNDIDYFDLDNKEGFYVSWVLADTASQTAANYTRIFSPYLPCELVVAIEQHTVAGSDAGAVTLQLEKLSTGTAPGAGVVILQTTFDLKSTANIPVIKRGKDLVFSTARQFKPTDSIALLSSGALTGLKGVQITLYFKFLGSGHYRV